MCAIFYDIVLTLCNTFSNIRASPPTSPQHAWAAGRQAERDQCVLGSPPSCRRPPSAASMASNIPNALIVSGHGFVNISFLIKDQ